MHCLVGVLAQAALDDGVHIERLDLTRVFAYQVTRLVPQLMVAFTRSRSKVESSWPRPDLPPLVFSL